MSHHFKCAPKVSVLDSSILRKTSDHLPVVFELDTMILKTRHQGGRIPSALYKDDEVRAEVLEKYKASLTPLVAALMETKTKKKIDRKYDKLTSALHSPWAAHIKKGAGHFKTPHGPALSEKRRQRSRAHRALKRATRKAASNYSGVGPGDLDRVKAI